MMNRSTRTPGRDIPISGGVFLVALVLVIGAACAPDPAARQRSRPTMRALGEKVSVEAAGPDETITREIRRLFALANPTGLSRVSIEVNDGNVVLGGVVPTPQAARQAEAAAWSTAGVRQVTSRILVQHRVVR